MLRRPLLSLLTFVLPPLSALALSVGTATVNTNSCDTVAWNDGAGKPRTVSIVQAQGNASYAGGYISRMTWMAGATPVTADESGAGGNLSGLGQLVNHDGTTGGGTWACSKTEGVRAGATTTVLFNGANHLMYQVDMNMYGHQDHSGTLWHVRWVYMFRTGNDRIVDAIGYDFSSSPASTFNNDMRSPYCEFNWTGTGAAKTLSESIDGIEYLVRGTGGSNWIFRTVGGSPFSAGYTFNTPGGTVPYCMQYKSSPDREMGYIRTLDTTQDTAGGGYTSQVTPGGSGAAMPANWGINYQSNGFQNWVGDKLTWGMPYGAGGQAAYDDWTYSYPKWSGYPTQGYTILIQTGTHSDGGTAALAAEQDAIHKLTTNALTAAVGTVNTSGPKHPLDSGTLTFKPAGYNHLYDLWDANCASNLADLTLALGSASLKNQTFAFRNYTAGSAGALTLNGTPLVEGTTVFSSVDTVNHVLYTTLSGTLTGSCRLVLGAAGTATVTPAVTATMTATPGAAGNKDWCLSIDYSAVPALVNKRKLTLKVDVGACSSVLVTADGVGIPASYNAGTATFTTSGSAIVVTAMGWTGGGTGLANKAALQDDKRWAFSMTFDDAIQTQYDNAKPLLDAKGWKAGSAVIGSGPDTNNSWNMSWAEILALKNAGWDIYNHSYTHPNLTCANFATEFQQNQTTLQSHLPGYNASHIVYPYENTAATSCAGFPPSCLMSGEGGGGGYNSVDSPLPNVFTAQRATFYGTDASPALALAASAAGAAGHTWLINITHGVTAGSGAPADAYSTNATTLGGFFNSLDTLYGTGGAKNMWFAPAGEVYDFMLTRDNAVVSTCVLGTATSTPTPCAACTSTYTRTASPTASPTPTATTAPACTSTLLDDGETGLTANKMGGYWYVYAGGSTINPATYAMSTPGHVSTYCARAYGNCVAANPPSLGTSLNAGGVNWSGYSGISFWFKGDGSPIRFQVHSLVEGANYNDYKWEFTPPVGWSLVTIPFSSLVFPGWGPAYSLDTTQVSGIAWVPLTAGAFDISVDDVWMTCANAPTATPTLSRTPTPASPTGTMTASPTPTPTSSFTPGSSTTATGTISPGSSPTSTNTNLPSATPSASPSASATPSQTSLPTASDTITAGPSPTGTPSLTASASQTPYVAPPTATNTPRPGAATATSTPQTAPPMPPVGEEWAPNTLSVIALPNPNPAALSLKLDGPADRVSLKLYSAAYTLVAGGAAPLVADGRRWQQVPLPPQLRREALPAGLYYFSCQASLHGRQGRAAVGKAWQGR